MNGFGILELHERLTEPSPPLQLHVVHDGETGVTYAGCPSQEEKRIGYVVAGARIG